VKAAFVLHHNLRQSFCRPNYEPPPKSWRNSRGKNDLSDQWRQEPTERMRNRGCAIWYWRGRSPWPLACNPVSKFELMYAERWLLIDKKTVRYLWKTPLTVPRIYFGAISNDCLLYTQNTYQHGKSFSIRLSNLITLFFKGHTRTSHRPPFRYYSSDHLRSVPKIFQPVG